MFLIDEIKSFARPRALITRSFGVVNFSMKSIKFQSGGCTDFPNVNYKQNKSDFGNLGLLVFDVLERFHAELKLLIYYLPVPKIY